MNFWKKLFGIFGKKDGDTSQETYKCRSCGRKTSGQYLVVGMDDPFAPPYYGGRICDKCAKKLDLA